MQLEAQTIRPIQYSIVFCLDQSPKTPPEECTYTVKRIDYTENRERGDDEEYSGDDFDELAYLRYEEVADFCKRLENKDPELIAEFGLPIDYEAEEQSTLVAGLQDSHNLGLAEVWGVPKPITMQRHYLITDRTQHIVIQKSLISVPDFDEDENEDDTLAPLRINLIHNDEVEPSANVECRLNEFQLIANSYDVGDSNYNWIVNFSDRRESIEEVACLDTDEIREIEDAIFEAETSEGKEKHRRKIYRLVSAAYRDFAKEFPVAFTLHLKKDYSSGPWQYYTDDDVEVYLTEAIDYQLDNSGEVENPHTRCYGYALMSRQQILDIYGGVRLTKGKIKRAEAFVKALINRLNCIAAGEHWQYALDFDNANFPNLEKGQCPDTLTQITYEERNDFESKIERLDPSTLDDLGLSHPEDYTIEKKWEDREYKYSFVHKHFLVKTERLVVPKPLPPQQE